MATLKNNVEGHTSKGRKEPENLEEAWETHIKSVIDIVREPVLVLDGEFRVRIANEAFSKVFQIDMENADGVSIYTLGNGQWNIPALRTLLEEILPQNTFFKGFEIAHEFPFLGPKHLIINARLLNLGNKGIDPNPSYTCLAIEDVSAIMSVAETVASQVRELASRSAAETRRLEAYVNRLEKEITGSQKRRHPMP